MNHISRDIQFDDPKHYSFSRSSGLPLGYFQRERKRWPSVDKFVMVLVVVLGFVAAVIP